MNRVVIWCIVIIITLSIFLSIILCLALSKEDRTTGTDAPLKKSETVVEGIIVGMVTGVFTISLSGGEKTIISQEGGQNVAFDWIWRKAYWSSLYKSLDDMEFHSLDHWYCSIQRANIDGQNLEGLADVKLHALDVDSITGNMYYGNEASTDLRVCSSSVQNCSVLAKNQRNVHDIALHPAKSLMFWTNNTSTVRANTDGTDSKVILSKSVRHIVVDEDMDRLYWIDGDQKFISSSDLNGNDERVIRNSDRPEFSLITVVGDKVYFYTLNRTLTSINKDGRNPAVISLRTHISRQQFYDMAAYGSKSYVRSNPCESSPCSHLCVLKLESFVCLCPEGKRLDQDHTTCV